MIYRCPWPECHTAITYKGKGRPPKYCPPHAIEARRVRESNRSRSKIAKAAKLMAMRICDRDAHAANARKRICDQCQQWQAFKRDSLRMRGNMYQPGSEQWEALVAMGEALGTGAERGWYIEDLTARVKELPDPGADITPWADLALQLNLCRFNSPIHEKTVEDEFAEDNRLTDNLDRIGTALATVAEHTAQPRYYLGEQKP